MTDDEKDLIKLWNILLSVIEANKGTKDIDGRICDAEGLVLKFSNHALSFLYLFRGLNISEMSIPINNFQDPSSANIIARAAFECYLIFYYIYINPKNKDEESLRYYSWVTAGLYERQKYAVTVEENIDKLREEKEQIQEYLIIINSNSVFESYPDKDKKEFQKKLRSGYWKFRKNWVDIAIDAGFSIQNSNEFYKYISGHVHSGNVSVFQNRQAMGFDQRRKLIEGTLSFLNICIAKMIKHYCQYFSKSNEYYISNYKEPNLVTEYIEIA